MSFDIVAVAAEAWAEVAKYLAPVLVVFGLGNRLMSMVINAVEGKNAWF